MKSVFKTMTFLSALVVPIAAQATPETAWLNAPSSTVLVVDGDTLEVAGRPIQLEGIDAPELGQACDENGALALCGLNAAYALRKMIVMQPASALVCVIRDDKAQPAVASCLLGELDISRAMIAAGHAVATRDAPVSYITAEHQARHAEIGIWRGNFIPPRLWRTGKRLPQEHAFDPATRLHNYSSWHWNGHGIDHTSLAEHAACLIKGKVLDDKSHIYFGPLDPNYDTISIDLSRGDRLFCGDEDARKAGWSHVTENRERTH